MKAINSILQLALVVLVLLLGTFFVLIFNPNTYRHFEEYLPLLIMLTTIIVALLVLINRLFMFIMTQTRFNDIDAKIEELETKTNIYLGVKEAYEFNTTKIVSYAKTH